MKRLLLILVFLAATTSAAHAQFSSVSTNLAGWAVGNLNIALDFSLDKRNTINIPLSGNPFAFGNTRWQHIALQPGWRHWSIERYVGRFVSLYLVHSTYAAGWKRSDSRGYANGIAGS